MIRLWRRLISRLVFLFRTRFWVLVLTLFFAAAGGSFLSLIYSYRALAERQALDAAGSMATAVFEARDLYNERAIKPLKTNDSVAILPQPPQKPNHIPIPATFLIELSQNIKTGHSGQSMRYFSAYPFPWRRAEGGPKDDFERQALQTLAQDPQSAFSRVEPFQGELTLRYVQGDVMKPACVECHNAHPDSPKRDWRVGDLRGALEVNYPLETFQRHTYSGLQVTFGLLTVALGLALAILALGFREALNQQTRLRANETLRRLNADLEARVEARTQALRDNQERLKLQERAIAASSNGIIIVDARQSDNPTIFVNPAFEKMSGYSIGEVLGKNCRFLQGQEHDQPGLRILRQALKAGSSCKVTVRNYRKDGSAFWNELNISPIYDDEGALTHYIGIQMDVSQRIQSEEEQKQTNQLLATTSQAQAQFIAAGQRLAIFEGLLSSLLELSDSEYGFIGEVLFRADGSAVMEESFLKIRGVPFLKAHSITNIAWDEATRKFYDEHYEEGMEFANMNTLFGAVIMTGQPVIANDPQSDPRRGGTPSGHPPLRAFLGIPFFSGAQLIGMVGVANRPGGYDSALVELLRPFLITCSNLIDGYRLDRQRQSAESRLKASLKEKEILLKEIHHRVKNNLLVVSSLLNWQGESLQDPKVLQVFADSQKRINSLALIHEKLYRSQDLAQIDLGDYLESLVGQLYNSLRDERQSIDLQLNLEPVAVNIETATPCGLIVNELVCNAFEHAFPDGRWGSLAVGFSRDEEGLITLTVRDDGVGFPPDLDFRQTESLGWQLICLLTEQLEGEVQVCCQGGAEVILTFRELNYHNRLESS